MNFLLARCGGGSTGGWQGMLLRGKDATRSCSSVDGSRLNESVVKLHEGGMIMRMLVIMMMMMMMMKVMRVMIIGCFPVLCICFILWYVTKKFFVSFCFVLLPQMMTEAERVSLVDNIVVHLKNARRDIQERQVITSMPLTDLLTDSLTD